MSEIILLLLPLLFLCVRTDYVQRTWAFVAAALVWGLARMLLDISSIGALDALAPAFPSLQAATALQVLCVMLIFWACRKPRTAARPPPPPAIPPPPPDEADQVKPLDRLRQVVD